jgi:alkaline phosphatase
MRYLILFIFCLPGFISRGQKLSTLHPPIFSNTSIFSHNDYAQAKPFKAAYRLKVGYVEADIFLHEGKLVVAHAANEMILTNTLESMYLIPLSKRILQYHGSPYRKPELPLSLSIDIKSESASTLNALIQVLEKYPTLVQAKNMHIIISGNRPRPEAWNQYPSYISFDGRPDESYTDEQWKKVGIVSESFTKYTHWEELPYLM